MLARLMEGGDLLEMTQTADDYYGNDLFKMLSKKCATCLYGCFCGLMMKRKQRQRRQGGPSEESNCCRGDVIKDS